MTEPHVIFFYGFFPYDPWMREKSRKPVPNVGVSKGNALHWHNNPHFIVKKNRRSDFQMKKELEFFFFFFEKNGSLFERKNSVIDRNFSGTWH